MSNMSITFKQTRMHPIPKSAVPLYIVTTGDDPKIEEYRLSHETDRAYRVYATFGNDLTEYHGVRTISFHNLQSWGHLAFYDHRDALQCQRDRFVLALDLREKQAADVRARLSDHVEQWGPL